MIVVTGAAGQLGGQVVDTLANLVDPHGVGVSVRDPDQVEGLADRGIRVRRGDYDDLASMIAAFEDADQVLIVSANKLGKEARRLPRSAIEAARSAGACRILYTSHMGARIGSSFAPADQHAGTEGRPREYWCPVHIASPRLLRRKLSANGGRRASAGRPARS